MTKNNNLLFPGKITFTLMLNKIIKSAFLWPMMPFHVELSVFFFLSGSSSWMTSSVETNTGAPWYF